MEQQKQENLPSATQKFAEINPQQNFFQFGDIQFDSRFDSGNLSKVTNPEPQKVRFL